MSLITSDPAKLLRQALIHAGSISALAVVAGIHRATIYRAIKAKCPKLTASNQIRLAKYVEEAEQAKAQFMKGSRR